MSKTTQHLLIGFGSFLVINVLWMIVTTGILQILPAHIRIINIVLLVTEVALTIILYLRNKKYFAIGGFIAVLLYFVTPYLLFMLKVNQ